MRDQRAGPGRGCRDRAAANQRVDLGAAEPAALGQSIGHPRDRRLSRTAFSSGVAGPGGTITQGRGHLVTSSLHRRYRDVVDFLSLSGTIFATRGIVIAPSSQAERRKSLAWSSNE